MRSERAYGEELVSVSKERRFAPSGQVMLKGVARECTARAETELTVQGTHMGVDGVRTHDELLGDLGVGQSPCHQAQHLHLARRQSIGIGGWRFRWRR